MRVFVCALVLSNLSCSGPTSSMLRHQRLPFRSWARIISHTTWYFQTSSTCGEEPLEEPQVCLAVHFIQMNTLMIFPGTIPTDDPSFVARNDDPSFAQEITTKNGTVEFHIDIDSTSGRFISGVLDSIRPFCIGRGFVEMGLLLPNGTEGKLFVRRDICLSISNLA